MSLIIKGLDKPCCGEEIRISIYGHGAKYGEGESVVATEFYLDDDGDRRCRTLDVEAIQIPKGHGRLIDEKQAWSKVEKRKDGHSVITFNAPTILEAEET